MKVNKIRPASMLSRPTELSAVLHLDCHSLVIFEPAEAVLGFQGVAIGVLRRVEGGRWQVFPGIKRTSKGCQKVKSGVGDCLWALIPVKTLTYVVQRFLAVAPFRNAILHAQRPFVRLLGCKNQPPKNTIDLEVAWVKPNKKKLLDVTYFSLGT